MRYGENSHQQAAFYIEENVKKPPLLPQPRFRVKPSLITTRRYRCGAGVRERVRRAGMCDVKHANPCGVAIGNSILDAYVARTKPTQPPHSAASLPLTAARCGNRTGHHFSSVCRSDYWPSASEEALKITAAKQNVRVRPAVSGASVFRVLISNA